MIFLNINIGGNDETMKKQIPDTGGDAAGVEEGSSGEDQPPQL